LPPQGEATKCQPVLNLNNDIFTAVMNRKYFIILLLSIFIAVFMLAGFFLPKQIEVRNEVTIKQSPVAIYSVVNNLNTWQQWSIWSTEIDSSMTYKFSDEMQKMMWNGNYGGNGSITFTGKIPDSEIQTFLSLQDDKFNMPGIIRLEIIDAQTTRVSWTNTIKLGNNPLKRYLGSSIQNVVHRDIGECLNGLQKFISSQPVS
jgi:hypothetical protein